MIFPKLKLAWFNYVFLLNILIFGCSKPSKVTENNSVDSTTLQGKFLFGYQGWFSAPGDGSLVNSWFHWTKDRKVPALDNMAIDLWPDLSEFDPDELINTPLKYPDGKNAKVFSSYNFKTVRRHFQWMKDYGIDGVFLQRFLSELQDPRFFHFRNEVTKNVLRSAKETGRVIALMYDLSGSNETTLVQDLIKDWKYMVDELHLLDTNRYLHHRSRPLLALWGIGFKDRKITPTQVVQLINWFTKEAPQKYRVTLMAGVPTFWRGGIKDVQNDSTWELDADPNPRWQDVYKMFSVISPWMVGRIKTIDNVDKLVNVVVKPDLLYTKDQGIEYLPVVFPGFSWANLKGGNNYINVIPRLGGRFYWKQIYAQITAGNKMLYGAMFDEIDEGTAIMKAAPSLKQTPVAPRFLSLDADGMQVPSDLYLKISGYATSVLKRRN